MESRPFKLSTLLGSPSAQAIMRRQFWPTREGKPTRLHWLVIPWKHAFALRLRVKGAYHHVRRCFEAAVLDPHIGIVGLSGDRCLVRQAAILAAPIPDRLAIPVVGLKRVFAVATILNVDIDRGRGALLVVRPPGMRQLIQTLFFERPANDFVVGAA